MAKREKCPKVPAWQWENRVSLTARSGRGEPHKLAEKKRDSHGHGGGEEEEKKQKTEKDRVARFKTPLEEWRGGENSEYRGDRGKEKNSGKKK